MIIPITYRETKIAYAYKVKKLAKYWIVYINKLNFADSE